ncbi:hypothetical protein B0T17DRAFT_512220 [Bombardia bombarda]|uniref:Uncharacterized protein n=1 Tax=Bombardia bombarda TaxID=252184 RepID=A0AA39WCD4_9PEZI|nr:hypothetical protein B0T17DRAFT_512220 [Bombardia bombarda]
MGVVIAVRRTRILVTGAVTVASLLAAGFSVRGVVDHLSNGQTLLDALGWSRAWIGRLEIVVITSLSRQGALDDVIKGSVTVLTSKISMHRSMQYQFLKKDANSTRRLQELTEFVHVPEPIDYVPGFSDPQLVVDDSVNDVLGVLRSAAAEPRVRSFVYLSSAATITSPRNGAYTFTESDWNTASRAVVDAQGMNPQTNGLMTINRPTDYYTMGRKRSELPARHIRPSP